MVLWLGSPIGPLSAQAPEGRSRDRLERFAEAFSTGDSATMSRFVQASFATSFLTAMPLRTHLLLLRHMYEASGGWHAVQVTSATDSDATALVRDRKSGASSRVSIRLEASPPYGISDLSVERVSAGPTAPHPVRRPESDAQLGARLDSMLRRLASHDSLSGAVLVARGDTIVFARAYGLAERNWLVPNTVETRFNLASMAKMFTAVAIAQLIEQGKVRLDDPIARHLGQILPGHAGDRIQVRHLLSHTSGLGDYLNDPRWERGNQAEYRVVDDYLPLLAHDSGSFAPGTRYSYSNSGYVLLGKVIEAVSGEAYDRYVTAHVFRPAGMMSSGFFSLDSVASRLAVGYVREDRGGTALWSNNLFQHVVKGGPAGGSFSTVGDLHRFARALQAGRLVSPALVRLLLAPKPELGARSYGFGFATSDSARVVGHAGGFPGIVGNLDMFSGSDVITVVLGNLTLGHSGAGATLAIDELRAWLGDTRPAPGGEASGSSKPAPGH
jgi:CubicO group peptidase (beta-lactamase class C family)